MTLVVPSVNVKRTLKPERTSTCLTLTNSSPRIVSPPPKPKGRSFPTAHYELLFANPPSILCDAGPPIQGPCCVPDAEDRHDKCEESQFRKELLLPRTLHGSVAEHDHRSRCKSRFQRSGIHMA